MNIATRTAALLLSFWASALFAKAPGEVVKDFRLQDQRGQSHRLYDAVGAKAVVLMVHGNGCPIVRQSVPALAAVRAKYESQGVQFLLFNSNMQDTSESIAQEAAEFEMDFPILVDGKQTLGEALGVVRTAEVFVIDPKNWKLIFRGPIDDRLSYENQRPAAKHTYLTDALDSVLAGRPVKVARAEGVGCIVNFPHRGH
jgi:peroxiredoxin